MTVQKPGPYPRASASSSPRGFVIFRLLVIAPLGALVACAGDAASRKELAELRAELRAMQRAQDRLEKRVERAETIAAVASARRAQPAPREREAAPASEEADAIPELTVVKLKPRREPAPRIDTRVPVMEPPPEVVDELVSPPGDDSEAFVAAAPGPEGSTARAGADADKQFDQALEALRTGNLEGASTALEAFAAQHPRHARADNALYFSALGYIGQEEHDRAAEVLQRLVRDYPAGDAVLDALLKLAECHLKLEQPAVARDLYHRVISNYPGTAAANQAQAKLASLSP